MPTTPTDKLLAASQRLIPARTIGRIIYGLTRNKTRWLKNFLIVGFTKLFKVDTAEAAKPVPDGYDSFNDFFTRSLKPGARVIDDDAQSLICPADGRIAQLGRARDGQLLQAKGMHFSAGDLLGDSELAAELADCHFITIYLAPYNYHRLHMPLAGELEQSIFIPGRLYSVNLRTASAVPNLYSLNERLVCRFNGPIGRFALVLVGAMNVASISTAWHGEIQPRPDGLPFKQSFSGSGTPRLAKGEYLGHFNMGSTIVLLGPEKITEWRADLRPGAEVRVGQSLARVATR